MKVKNKYAYVITQDIYNKFIEVNCFVGCMVSRPNRLLQDSTTMSFINKMPLPLSVTWVITFYKNFILIFSTIVPDCMDRESVDTLDLSIAVTDQNTTTGQNSSTSKFDKFLVYALSFYSPE